MSLRHGADAWEKGRCQCSRCEAAYAQRREALDRPRCGVCSKLIFTEDEAKDAVRRAFVDQVTRGRSGRRERGIYPCPVRPGKWHLTSNPQAAWTI